MVKKTIKHRPATWSRLTGIVIMDPDGWRIDGKSWSAPIDEEEWNRRRLMSTVNRKGLSTPTKAQKKDNKNVFEIYPTCEKPKWIKKGAKCHCLGEGLKTLVVLDVGDNAAFLLKSDKKTGHGWESFTKLYPLGGTWEDVAKEV